ncbi:type II secretion system F family protein [Xinfangfangia sp. D13-10-4-6]|uniref:type II secretion system F family protein n=1 Tax=Pseudogemmobacter hezensis TaxID=2737662 RepID=UPI0015578BBC|nr:type II secretion system F family protein [Pseudogemmobacter hezensis]NPD16969.1 type II secretion system F family protein [Pseudogemmobacter hezensis]
MTASLFFLGSFILGGSLFGMAMLLVSRAPDRVFERKIRSEPGEPTSGDTVELRRQLAQAGFTHPDAPRIFQRIRLGLLLIMVGLAAIAISLPALLGERGAEEKGIVLVAAFLVGYFLPTMAVDRRRKAWMKRISIALPDALDFMLVCVEAGQTTDLALLRVAEEIRPVHPDLSAQLTTLNEALTAGAERHDAWHRLATETENDDLRQLATIVVQSGHLGTPIAQTLRVFSADLRDRRVRQIEERANVLPTKMTLGTMIFTVPPLLILLLAPSFYRLIMTN